MGKRREGDPLEGLEGVGPKTLERLRELGVTSVEHLAEFTVEELVEAGVEYDRAVKILQQAIQRVGTTRPMYLLMLAAIAVTHERTRVLGAIVLGVATAAPALVTLADTLVAKWPPDSVRLTGWHHIVTFWDWGAVVDKAKAIYEAAVTAGIGLSVFIAVAAAVAYLFSRVPHAIGVE